MGANDQGADATDGYWTVIPRAVCFVTHGDDLLLLKRASHRRVFPNKYCGLGGHIERDESPLQAIMREVREESGLEVKNVRLRGVTNIDAGGNGGILLFFYSAEALSRDFTDTDEGTLEWVPLSRIYQKDLVEDLPIILPRLFGENASNTPFSAHTSYDDNDQLCLKFTESN